MDGKVWSENIFGREKKGRKSILSGRKNKEKVTKKKGECTKLRKNQFQFFERKINPLLRWINYFEEVQMQNNLKKNPYQ